MYSIIALLLLSTVSFALDPNDFMPFAFQVSTLTHIYSEGSEIATSEDTVYHDHDNLWRWDSDFSGVAGLFDPHSWIIVWRPDNGASYHHQMLTGQCLKNNGASKMYPYPYDWIASKCDNLTWSEDYITLNGKSAIRYSAVGKSSRYNFVLNTNIFTSTSGSFVFANGTVESVAIDINFVVEVNQYISNSPIDPKKFTVSKPCPETTMPADPSRDFTKFCYHTPSSTSSNAGFSVIPSIVALFFALLMCIAL